MALSRGLTRSEHVTIPKPLKKVGYCVVSFTPVIWANSCLSTSSGFITNECLNNCELTKNKSIKIIKTNKIKIDFQTLYFLFLNLKNTFLFSKIEVNFPIIRDPEKRNMTKNLDGPCKSEIKGS